MDAPRKVAVVSGSNRGVGLGVVRSLCKRFDGDVYLTSRNVENGRNAVALLEAEGLKPKFHQLDIASPDSIVAIKQHIEENYGGIDLLVNNAAMAYKAGSAVPFVDQAIETVGINFTGTLNLTRAFIPLLRPHARIVDVSSGVSNLNLLGKELQDRFMSPTLTVDGVEELIQEFLDSVAAGDHKEKGWPSWPNAVAKHGMNALTRIHAKELAKGSKEDILVNSCCPGWVQTNMADDNAPLTVDQGAETPVYLAMLPAGGPTGCFWIDSKQVPWEKIAWNWYDSKTYVW